MSILNSHYRDVDGLLSNVKTLCNARKIKLIAPQSRSCQERYPCGGHGGAVITFEDGDVAHYPCSSVDLGIIMYYYGIKDDHFTGYVNQELRNKLDIMKA